MPSTGTLDKQVISDLELDKLASVLSLKTSWGKDEFYNGLLTYSASIREIKQRQLPLLALRNQPVIREAISEILGTIKPDIIDDSISVKDSRIVDSVSQVLWKPDSFGSFLNSSPTVLNFIITWKTIILPGFAVLMPLIAVIVPFFVLRYVNPSKPLETGEYLERVKSVVLQQISIPSFLKSRGETDRIGFMLESLFIGLTLAMFISSLWNQITASMNLRNVWNDLALRGQELQHLRTSAKQILDRMTALPLRNVKGLKYLISEGEAVLEQCKGLEGLNNVSTFGTVWNSNKCIHGLKAWIGKVDVIVAIASLPGICFPKPCAEPCLELVDLVHPLCKPCVSNNFSSSSHTILTGPNRGGKSTFCKATGLAVVTAQTWGFAWASAMSWSPYKVILTALEPYGKLGEYSTFEAEIDFAKSVLEIADRPAFIMMDEIFHSTNATDGLAASSVFLGQLYKKTGIVSIVSTHYRQLAEQFAKEAIPLYMVAEDKEHGKLSYSYKVAAGISDKSSVMEILYERGLISDPSDPSEPGTARHNGVVGPAAVKAPI